MIERYEKFKWRNINKNGHRAKVRELPNERVKIFRIRNNNATHSTRASGTFIRRNQLYRNYRQLLADLSLSIKWMVHISPVFSFSPACAKIFVRIESFRKRTRANVYVGKNQSSEIRELFRTRELFINNNDGLPKLIRK